MHKIIFENGKVLGYVEEVRYIRKSENGSYVPCVHVEAQGVAVNSVAYPLIGHTEIPGDPVVASMCSDMEYMTLMQKYEASIHLAKKQARTLEDDDEKLHVSVLYDDWQIGSYSVGDVYNTHPSGEVGSEWEQTWECFQAYDNETYPDIVPGNSSWYTFNRPLHGKSPETARPFVPVQGAHDMYRTGEYMIYTDGKTYRCKQDTNFSPDEYAEAWEAV